METIYRDYGTIGNNPYPANQFTVTLRGLVYLATHGGDDHRLPFMNRSFISFTYGGIPIEDFNLIATIDGDRMSRAGYSDFEDMTSSYDNLDGLKFWGTHYKINTLELNLSTDGMDLRQLDDFLYWFLAGVARELILAEHPNRALLARVVEPPQLSMLPFGLTTTIMINNESYSTKTTLYKGDINLRLVMDSPHWYGITNILGTEVTEGGKKKYIDYWQGPNDAVPISIYASLDALKILLEDGIPLGSMIQDNMLLGNGGYANVNDDYKSKIWSKDEGANDFNSGVGAKIDSGDKQNGIIAGAIVNADGNGITSLALNALGYFYYSGTAPSPTVIKFTMTPSFDGNGYINSPYNSHTTTKFNTIEIGSTTTQKLCFTTPNIFTSYNKAIEIFRGITTGVTTREEVREKLRDEVRHPYAREWAIKVIDLASVGTADKITETINNLVLHMKFFLAAKTSTNSPTPLSATFLFNSGSGEARGWFLYRKVASSTVSDWYNYGDLITNGEEDVGDMLRSNYIIIRDRNYPTSNGTIVSYSVTNKKASHYIKHDVSSALTNLSILYRNMYL